MAGSWLLWLSIIGITTVHAQQQDRIPPTITTQPEPTYFDVGIGTTLRCAASGQPAPLYTWRKNGMDVSTNKTTGDYVVNSPTDSDAGYYMCQATNTWGTAISKLASLTKAYINSFTDRTTMSQTQTFGQKLSLQCRGPPTSTPAAKYSWVHAESANSNDFVQFQFNERIQVHDVTGTIYFANCQSADSILAKPLFACQATNGVLATTKTGSFWNVTGSGTSTTSFIELAFRIPDASTVIVVEGGSVKLRCFYFGYPTPVITWDKIMTKSTPTVFNVTNSNTTMFVSDVSIADDQTVVRCNGRNHVTGAVEAQQTFRLIVEVVPVFDESCPFPSEIDVTVGKTVSVVCSPRAVPDATVVWYTNGRLLDYLPPRYQLDNGGKNLTITDVCLQCPDGSSDMMVLQCNASNVHGYVLGSTFINLLLQTNITESPEDQTVVAGQQAMFSCAAEADQSTTITFTWLFNGIAIANGSRENAHASCSVTSCILYVDEAGESDIGYYTCVASNGNSRGKATAYLTVVPEAQTSAPTTWLPPSTPKPPTQDLKPNPYITVTLNGTFYKATDITDPRCIDEYADEFKASLKRVVKQTADVIARGELCVGTGSDVIVAPGSIILIIHKNTGKIEFDVLVIPGDSIRATEQCSFDVQNFLENFSNWKQPIIANSPGCQPATFNPQLFALNDDTWSCL